MATNPEEQEHLLWTHFAKIDRLQFETYSTIQSVLGLSDSYTDDTESYEIIRVDTCKKANAFIKEIEEILKVIGTVTASAGGQEKEKLETKYTVYREKLNGLKCRLRDLQLTLSGLGNEYVHKQRVSKFLKDTQPLSADGEDLRKELFAGRSSENEAVPNNKTVKDQILEQNKSITNSLQLTRQLMSTTIMQTELNIESLDQQTKDLNQLNEKLIDLNTVLKRSRQIVKFIEKQDKQDKQRIYLSIGFLLLCCAWVLWRRVFKLPVKIMLWTFFKLFGIISWSTGAVENLPATSAVYMATTQTPFSASTITLEVGEQDTASPSVTFSTWGSVIEETVERIKDEL